MTHPLRAVLMLSTAALTAPAFAQVAPTATTSQPEVQAATSPAAPDASADEPEQEITVVGQKPRGSVAGDIAPEQVLDSRSIRATGATTISELLDAVAAQTGSARGRGGERPMLLLNGQRISGFRELRDLPPEAIERMEILPEEVSLKYGYPANQKVINIVLRQRFNSNSVEGGGGGGQRGELCDRARRGGAADHPQQQAHLVECADRRQ